MKCFNLINLSLYTSQLPLLKNSTYFLSSEEVQISKQIDDYFHTHMIVNRNIRMKRQIQELLSSNPSESLFFVFGAGEIFSFVQYIILYKYCRDYFCNRF